MTDKLTLPLQPSRYGLKPDERKALLELADQLHEFGDREVRNGNGVPPGVTWSTEGWQLAGDLRQFVDRLDRTLRTANETLEGAYAEIEKLRAHAKPSESKQWTLAELRTLAAEYVLTLDDSFQSGPYSVREDSEIDLRLFFEWIEARP